MTQPGRVPELEAGARVAPPPLPSGEVVLRPPPEAPKAEVSVVLQRLLPLMMLIGFGLMFILVARSGAGFARSPMFLVFPAMMAMSTVVMMVHGGQGARRNSEIDEARKDYLRHLAGKHDIAVRNAVAQRWSMRWRHPDPLALWTLAGTPRMWERERSDSNFCQVRIGLGSQPPEARIVVPDIESMQSLDPVGANALRTFICAQTVVEDVPIAVALDKFTRIVFEGGVPIARSLLRAVISQLAILQDPREVAIVAIAGVGAREHWEWLKWLPHHRHPCAADDGGANCMVYPDLKSAGIDQLRRSGFAHVVILIDGVDLSGVDMAVAAGNVTILERGSGQTGPRSPDILRLRLTEAVVTATDAGEGPAGRPDSMSLVEAETCARRLARYGRSARQSGAAVGCDWVGLLGLGDLATFDPVVLWRPSSDADRLRVPIGTSIDGHTVNLDMKEAAERGMGPHGLCIGATGSGKSEFLRTLVAGLIARNPPESLNLVLVDFKGGATFQQFGRTRHLAALITNLADEAHLVARMKDALAGEMYRRQTLLRNAGNFANVADYDRARSAGRSLDPLPALVVIVDEFAELVSQHPEFQDLFAAIGRLGRSLRIHLLLASQRLDESRLRGLESHLSYRVCLKTFSATESRAVIGTADAFDLTGPPGAAFLRVGAAEPVAFQVAYVSGQPIKQRARKPPAQAVEIFTAEPMQDGQVARHDNVLGSAGETFVEKLLERVAGKGAPAHPVWLPPLQQSPTLDCLIDPRCPAGGLRVAVGLIDSPFDQRRDSLIVDLAGSAGNVAIVGGPQSGKSTAVCTVVAGLVRTRAPHDIQFYCLDFGGGMVSRLAELPHVGAVAGRDQPDLVRKIIFQLTSVRGERERSFQKLGIDSMAGYRGRRACGDEHVGAEQFGDIFLVIDGWSTLRDEFETLTDPVTALAAAGLSYGIHVVLTASRWADVRPALKDHIGTRIELRLGDPADSEINRHISHQVPVGRPGRGITPDGRHLILALPRVDGNSSVEGLSDAIAEMAATLRDLHGTNCAPPVRLLPDCVDRNELIANSSRPEITIGIDERELRPVAMDFSRQPHLLILGESECGKTAALRLLCAEVVRTTTSEQAQLMIVDIRRTLLGVVDSAHLASYVPSVVVLSVELPGILERLRARIPGPEVDQQQLRKRSWWSGPEYFVIIDDYDFLESSAENPLGPLVELLPYSKDVGLHVIVARRSGGAARALFDPVLGRLRELGCMGLMMSANPDDGVTLGKSRSRQFPPGRGALTTRAGEQVVQVGWIAPCH